MKNKEIKSDSPSKLPMLFSLGLLAALVMTYFIVQASPVFSTSKEGRVFSDAFPFVSFALAGAGMALSYLYVSSQRQKLKDLRIETEREQNRVVHLLNKVIENDFSELHQQAETQTNPILEKLLQMEVQISSLKKEELLKKQHDQAIEVFLEILRKYYSIKDVSKNLIFELARYLHAEQGAIFILQQDSAGSLNLKDQIKVSAYFVSDRLEAVVNDFLLGTGLHGQVLKEAKTLVINDLPKGYIKIQSGLGENEPTSLLLVPLQFESKIIGVIELASFKPFQPSDVAFAEEIAAKSAATLFKLDTSAQTSKMLVEAQSLTAELKNRELELTRSYDSARIRDRAISASSNGIVISDLTQPDQPIIYVNDAFVQITGYTADEVVGRNCRFLQRKETDQEAVSIIRESVRAGKECTVLLRNFKKDGTLFYNELSLSPVRDDDGNITHYVGIQNDVTERIKTENQMRINTRALSSSSNGIVISDLTQPDQPIIYVNDAFVQITGYAADEVVGKNCRFLQGTETDQEAVKVIKESIKEGRECTVLLRNFKKDGSLFYNELSLSPVRDDDGNITHYVGIQNDVTERIKIENQMRINTRALSSSSNGIVISDLTQPDQPIIYVNPAFELITGYTSEEILGKNCRFLQGHETDQPVIRNMRNAIKNGREARVLLRNYKKDGTLFYNELNLSPVKDDTGKVTHFVGIQNDVTERIRKEQEIKQMNEGLEERVKSRTSELQSAMDELKNAQTRVIQSEKLASLGQLIAGVAHEINTPLAAIKAAAENMTDFLPQAMRDLPSLLLNMSDANRTIFLELVDESMKTQEELTTRDERNLRKQYEDTLNEAGVDGARDMAKRLVTNGIRSDLSRFIPLLLSENSRDIIQTAYHLAQMKSNLSVIGQAAAKTRKTVYALKRYSHFQQDDSLEQIDLNDSLEVILTLYHNQLKQGVTVIRQFSEVPAIMGYGDELGQVWTNIIHNAAQAMKFNGTLTIETSLLNNDFVQAKLIDNGPGIPPEIKERIFEAFFTTKPQGEGTGLGLDIVRKIVEKHRGKIEVDSEPGRTCFTVTLPIDLPRIFAKEEAEKDLKDKS